MGHAHLGYIFACALCRADFANAFALEKSLVDGGPDFLAEVARQVRRPHIEFGFSPSMLIAGKSRSDNFQQWQSLCRRNGVIANKTGLCFLASQGRTSV